MLSRLRNSGYNLLILCLTLSAVVFALAALLQTRPAPQAAAQPSVPAASSSPIPLYTVRAVGNRVVIYQTGLEQPVIVTEIDLRSLPDADQAALRKGITLADATALAHLLEDYDG